MKNIIDFIFSLREKGLFTKSGLTFLEYKEERHDHSAFKNHEGSADLADLADHEMIISILTLNNGPKEVTYKIQRWTDGYHIQKDGQSDSVFVTGKPIEIIDWLKNL